jgi:hypothetical protein
LTFATTPLLNRRGLNKEKASTRRLGFSIAPNQSMIPQFYDKTIDFEKRDRFQQPWTRDFSDDDIRLIIDEPLLVPFLQHTQYVKRAIRVITQLGSSSTSDKKGTGWPWQPSKTE